MRALVSGFALLTLACGAAATNNALADSAEAQRDGGDAWAGHYEGPTDGGQGILDVRAGRASGSYDVRMELAAPGCGGDAEGAGVISNGRLIVTAPTMTGEQCILEFTRSGSSLRSTEAGACAMQHGPSCDFTGTLRRTGTAQGGRQASAPRGQPENPATAYAELVRSTDNGGMPNCFDPNLKGRERAVAERLGGSPCGSTTAAPTRGSSWIVGGWIERDSSCSEGGITYRADGTYITDIQFGRWQLNGTALIETPLRNDEEGGEVENPQPQRSQILSVAANHNAFTVRYPDGRVWNMKRCH